MRHPKNQTLADGSGSQAKRSFATSHALTTRLVEQRLNKAMPQRRGNHCNTCSKGTWWAPSTKSTSREQPRMSTSRSLGPSACQPSLWPSASSETSTTKDDKRQTPSANSSNASKGIAASPMCAQGLCVEAPILTMQRLWT